MRVQNPWRMPGIDRVVEEGVGSIFYVSGAGGDNGNTGLQVETPFATLTYAIQQCSGTTEDYIFVINHDNSLETFPIIVDVDNVHLIGSPLGSPNRPQIRVFGNVDGFTVTGTGVEIAGFWINTNAQADTGTLVSLEDDCRWFYFHDNFVAWRWWGGARCMVFTDPPYAGSDSLICNNYFGAHGWNVGGYAMEISSGTGRLVIRDNMFVQVGYQTGGSCIFLGSANHCCILNNNFVVEDAVDSAIIMSGAGTVTNLIDGNVAMSGVAAPGAGNCFDITGTNHWGLNYRAITAGMPA